MGAGGDGVDGGVGGSTNFRVFGVSGVMQIQFREYDHFDLWIWVCFQTAPSEMEKQYVEELFDSWFYLGKLGGFNAENLQVQEEGLELSYMRYDGDAFDRILMAPMHNMGRFEYLGTWGRCCVRFGHFGRDRPRHPDQRSLPIEQGIRGSRTTDYRRRERRLAGRSGAIGRNPRNL